MLPLQRRRKLVIEELADETLVYDQARHKAHCLNRTAGLVWNHCDGRTTPAQIAAMLARELATPVSAEVVAAALADLERARLLEAGSAPASGARRVSRRHAAGQMAVAGLAAVVATITAPVAAQAASVGDCCSLVTQCRGGLNCVGSGHPECARCPGGKCCV